MLKNTFKALTTLTLLVGCYFGYVRAFGWVVHQFRSSNSAKGTVLQTHDSNSKLQAAALAKEVFGENHWSVVNKLPYAFYNAERRFWMYTLSFEEIKEENGVKYDGKRQRLKPFAMIFKSNDGKSNQVLTSEEATLDMNQALSLSGKSDAEALKLKHAVFERDVRIRDDRGTPRDPRDDMNIGPLRHVEYDDDSHQITTDDHVIIQDPDTLVTGDGMLIQLRSKSPEERALNPKANSGFGGADYVIFRKNVHVFMRNVGDSGILPGSSPSGKTQTASATIKPGEKRQTTEPVPLDIVSDGEMRIDMADDPEPVLIGPPEPPEPTRVQFNRNVVACRGRLDRGPDQLTCDTLNLTLVPGDSTPPTLDAGSAAAVNKVATAQPLAKTTSDVELASGDPATEGVGGKTAGTPATAPDITSVTASGVGKEGAAGSSQVDADAPGAAPKGGGLFGNLTLKRAHATGHAVWLNIPASGMKLRCNELIHDRRLPFESDRTYVRGDAARRVWIEKIATVGEEGPDKGKVASVTHIWTDDATMFDTGGGMDKSNIRTRGPGRLETRSDRDPPYERIAIWQKELNVYNVLAPDGEIQTKLIWLEGNHPQFYDKLKNVSIDSAESIKLWLKPRSVVSADTNKTASDESVNADIGVMAAEAAAPGLGTGSSIGRTSTASSGDVTGGGFRIEKLLAIRDVHLLAPSRKMAARERLDADFIEAEPTAPGPKMEIVASNEDVAAAQPTVAAADFGAAANVAQNAAQPNGPEGQPNPKNSAPAPQQSTALPINAIADRVWAKVAMQPDADNPKSMATKPIAASSASPSNAAELNEQAPVVSADTVPVSAAPAGAAGPATEVRELWMSGTVSLHQDPAPDQKKGQDASGQALYMLNRGEGRALTKIFQRDPNEVTKPLTRLPLARVTTEEMDITGKIIQMDQEVDKIWVDGEGTLTQLTDTAAFTEKSAKPPETPDSNGKPEAEPAGADVAARGNASRTQTKAGQTTLRSTHQASRTDAVADEAKPKTKMRAGKPLPEKELMTITWTERMEFDGRTTDPEGRPAGRADFYGIVDTRMTDSALHCEQKMIAFTDKEVPLAQLGAISKPKTPANDGQENENAAEDKEPQAQLALIYCYGKPYAKTRTIDEYQPIVIKKQWIIALDRLDYDRRTGNFFVPGAGEVYLYERDKKSKGPVGSNKPAAEAKASTSNAANRTAPGPIVTPTSGHAPNRSVVANNATPGAHAAQPAQIADRNTIPPLKLTQIKFAKEMRGRFGSGQEKDKSENRWSEFFGDVQVRRGEISGEDKIFDFDKQLRKDDFFLTSQVLRVISEPVPIGSPANTPERTFMKAWEKATATTIDKVISSDVITYDSNNEQIHAIGEEGRLVQLAQQLGSGQPYSSSQARAVVLNPKTGEMHAYDNSKIVFVEESGSRPSMVAPPDPNSKPPKKPKQQFRINNGNLERRGFTGS